eukprot:141871_1
MYSKPKREYNELQPSLRFVNKPLCKSEYAVCDGFEHTLEYTSKTTGLQKWKCTHGNCHHTFTTDNKSFFEYGPCTHKNIHKHKKWTKHTFDTNQLLNEMADIAKLEPDKSGQEIYDKVTVDNFKKAAKIPMYNGNIAKKINKIKNQNGNV